MANLLLVLLSFIAIKISAQDFNCSMTQNRTIVVVLVEFSNKGLGSCNKDYLTNYFKGSSRAVLGMNFEDAIRFMSNDKVSVKVIDFLGPIKIRYNSNSGCEYDEMRSLANREALTLRADLLDHDIQYFIPENNCWFSGVATSGKGWSINANCTSSTLHTFGHNLGLSHAKGAIDSPMSYSYTNLPYSAPEKAKLGWINLYNISVNESAQSSQIELQPSDLSDNCVSRNQVAMLKGNKRFWFFSYRKKLNGFDSFPTPFFETQLNIHTSHSDKKRSSKLRYLLPIGENFTHPDLNNITIYAKELDSEKLTFQVLLPGSSSVSNIVIDKVTNCNNSQAINRNCTASVPSCAYGFVPVPFYGYAIGVTAMSYFLGLL